MLSLSCPHGKLQAVTSRLHHMVAKLQTECDSQDGHHHHHPRDAERPPEASADHGQLHADVHDQQGLSRPVCDFRPGKALDRAAVHHAAWSCAVVQPVCASLADKLWIYACIGWIPSL